METNTKEANTGTDQLDEVDRFLNQILDEKKITGDSPEIRPQLIADLRHHLMEQIDRAMVEALTPQQVTQLNELMDRDDTTDQQIQDFFRQSGVDSQQVVLNTMMRFRRYYLGAGE